jgi:hypothetical protein
MKVNLNRFTEETLGRVYGMKEFVTALDMAIPKANSDRELEISLQADERRWSDEEYVSERDQLDQRYRDWVSRFAHYATIILLHSLVEGQLFACADHVRATRSPAAPLRKTKRRALDRARRHLQDVAGFDVAEDREAWDHLLRLEQLRNIIVHGGGVVSEFDHAKVEALRRAYPGQLWIADGSEFRKPYVSISPGLCADFAAKVERFFRGLLSRVAV